MSDLHPSRNAIIKITPEHVGSSSSTYYVLGHGLGGPLRLHETIQSLPLVLFKLYVHAYHFRSLDVRGGKTSSMGQKALVYSSWRTYLRFPERQWVRAIVADDCKSCPVAVLMAGVTEVTPILPRRSAMTDNF
ncbi:hypothetical protein PGTUg99_025051 [Puccinia graminis f. sp. tritici]|uniref:Uncharacterized protein n=1 Tax=Puccinia graminis f. sp. tritici TaxID=56615 RepID=A0A5B0MXD4_PUCGR|nr:hypothetical protein PGTUg99_025051 [Puccinia graminis f. sp. tritici]